MSYPHSTVNVVLLCFSLQLVASELNPELLDTMCTNLTVFEYYFTLPPNSSYTMDMVQSSMCSLRINITVLLHEMTEDIDGFSDLLLLVRATKIEISSQEYKESKSVYSV